MTDAIPAPEPLVVPKAYVASKFENKEVVRHAQAELRRRGFEITYDWTPSSIDGMTEEVARAHQEKQAVKDFNGVRDCDVMLFIGHTGVKGTLVELGIALALEKRIFVVNPDQCQNVFFFLPNKDFFNPQMTFAEDVGEALEHIEEWLKKRGG